MTITRPSLGGELLGSGRIPTQALIAAVEADREAALQGA
jgi:hypothetical protein